MKIGAQFLKDKKCKFTVWAPVIDKIELKILSPEERKLPMTMLDYGYWEVIIENVCPGALYSYLIKDRLKRPDPASNFQPDGVHGPSQVIDHSDFNWTDGSWRGINLSQMIIYEIHVGTFTPQGNFFSITERLDDLLDLGVNTIELMPVAQFPGRKNWGYDGVYPFAVQNTYGGPEGLKTLVDSCHRKGIAVVLDVVYNHLGPEGNYLADFGPYFTDKYKTPWGQAINFDGPYSDEVRNYFIENAIYWFQHFHIDGLRVDAIHGITDMSATPFLQELAERIEQLSSEQGKKLWLIAESDLNDVRAIIPRDCNGYGFAAQWCDDFHHSLHTLLTEERQGYYLDFGKIKQLKKSLQEGFVYSGEYSRYRKKRHGNPSKNRPAYQFVVFSQNHDQVGNRAMGDRLSCLVSFEGLKLAAGMVILSPYVPLLFMGEEYGEKAPFLFFTDFSDPSLINAIKEGRKQEFSAFNLQGKLPDPQANETFSKAKVDWGKKTSTGNLLLKFYQYLIKLRKQLPALQCLDNKRMEVKINEQDRILSMRRWCGPDQVFCLFNFNKNQVEYNVSLPASKWINVLDSSQQEWGGIGSQLPQQLNRNKCLLINGSSFVIYKRT